MSGLAGFLSQPCLLVILGSSPWDLPSGEVPASTSMQVDPAPPKPSLLQDPYLSLLTADLTQPQGPLLARGGGGLDPAFGADFLQERGHICVNILATSAWTTGPGQWSPRDALASSKRTACFELRAGLPKAQPIEETLDVFVL